MPMTLGNSNTLYIRIGREKIIFARYDNSKQNTLNYHCFKVNKNISLNANMHKVIKVQSLTKNNIGRVYVTIDSPVTLIPLNDFDDEEMTDMYTYSIPDNYHRLHIFYDMLPLQNAVMLCSIDKDLEHTILETYPGATFHATQMPLALHFASLCKSTINTGKMFVYLYEEHLTIACFLGNQIQLLNTFNGVTNASNAIYLILSVAHEWNIKPDTDEIYLLGESIIEKTLLQQLKRYLPNTFPFKSEGKLERHIQLLKKDLPFDLIFLILKAF